MQQIAMLISESMRLNGALDHVANIVSKKYFNKSVLDISAKEIEEKLKEIKSEQDAKDKKDYKITRNACYFKLVLCHDRHTEKTVHKAVSALEKLTEQRLLSYAAAYSIVSKIKNQMKFKTKWERYYDSLKKGE